MFTVSMYPLIVPLTHLFIYFSCNSSKQGGYNIDFADILLLLKVPIFLNVPYTSSSFLKFILIGLTHRFLPQGT